MCFLLEQLDIFCLDLDQFVWCLLQFQKQSCKSINIMLLEKSLLAVTNHIYYCYIEAESE